MRDNYRYLGFTDTLTNTGGHLNTEDGIFTAPVSGTYLFSLHARPALNKEADNIAQIN